MADSTQPSVSPTPTSDNASTPPYVMPYVENLCIFCGVSFSIARVRRADEPCEAGWNYNGKDWITDYECPDSSGCALVLRPPEFSENLEHVAGLGCVLRSAYSGHRISVEEMKGCRAVQLLIKKREGWEVEDDDQEWERTGDYFLSGLGDGSMDEASLEPMVPVRHGVESGEIDERVEQYENGENFGPGFHPTCFEIFKQISMREFGEVDPEIIMEWFDQEGGWTWYKSCPKFPWDYATKIGDEQWWRHEPGCEYLVANPVDVPGLPLLLRHNDRFRSIHLNGETVYGWTTKQGNGLVVTPPSPEVEDKEDIPSDPFGKLSTELRSLVMDNLTSRDLANLRLASKWFRQLPRSIFRRFVFEEFPWLWEAKEMAKEPNCDWHQFFCEVKFLWGRNLRGLQNRQRIWRHIEELVKRGKKYKGGYRNFYPW